MKFKNILLQTSTILTVATFSSQILAENTSLETRWKPYVGGSAGYNRMSAANQWEQDSAGAPTQVGKSAFNAKGFLGLVHIGVQKKASPQTNIGGEFYGFFESRKASVQAADRVESLKRENGAGLKLKAGYLFDTHSFLYVHAGVEKASFRYAASIKEYPGVRGGIVTKKKYLWGAPFGIGIEASLSTKWVMRLEYTHTIYQRWNTGKQTIGDYESKAKVSPSQDSILLGVSYTF